MKYIPPKDSVSLAFRTIGGRIDQEMQEKERIERECFEKNYSEEVKKILSLAQSWRDIPLWVYEALTAREQLIIDNDEKAEILERAKEYYVAELEYERKTTADRNRYKQISHMLENLIPGNRAKMIAKRMAVYENKEKINI